MPGSKLLPLSTHNKQKLTSASKKLLVIFSFEAGDVFETDSHASQAGLEVAVWLVKTLTF